VIWLIVTLVLLFFLTYWITKHIQGIGYLLTGDGQIALVLYFVLTLPGVLLHEVSHAVVAWLLRVKVRHLSIGIRRKRGRHVALGSVDIARTDPIRASLIGLAPLVTGCGVILLISSRVFGFGRLGAFSGQAFWRELQGVLNAPDFGLWVYLVFSIGNAMLPSASDRRSWWVTLLFLSFVGAILYFAGLLDKYAGPLGRWARDGTSYLTYAFAVAAAVDLVFAAVLFLTEQGLALLGFGRIKY
jgi:hypothetical protein